MPSPPGGAAQWSVLDASMTLWAMLSQLPANGDPAGFHRAWPSTAHVPCTGRAPEQPQRHRVSDQAQPGAEDRPDRPEYHAPPSVRRPARP